MRLLKIIACVLIFCNLVFGQVKYNISGPDQICPECYTYQVIDNGGKLFPAVFTVTNLNDPNEQECAYVSNQSSVICFRCPGTYKVNAVVQGTAIDSVSKIVEVIDRMPLFIYPSTTNTCFTPDSISGSCPSVCSGSTIEYTVENQFNPAIITWAVYGAKEYVVLNNFSVRVTWGSGPSGSINALAFAPNSNCGTEGSYCVKITNDLKVDFNTNGNIFCANEEIIFQPENLDGAKYNWDFGNGESSSEIMPSYKYTKAGTYEVKLSVETACGCKGSIAKQITINDNYKPTLTCVSTICENTKQTYTSDADCGTFTWGIIGDGKIIEGGNKSDNYITIDWGKGPQGIVTLDVASCNFNLCTQKSSFSIPIIADNASITGNNIACKGKKEIYSVLKYNATLYQWTVVGGTITAGQGTHQIIVEWGNATQGKIDVAYNNCYLKCSGTSSKSIVLSTPYEISADVNTLCHGATAHFTSIDNGLPTIIDKWEVLDDKQNIIQSYTNKSTIEFLLPTSLETRYIEIVATSSNHCDNPQRKKIEVYQKSSSISGIIGEKFICKNIPYTYTASSLTSNALVEWTIKDGSEQKTMTGSKPMITWKSDGPYSLTVRQLDLSGNYCYSNTYSITVQKISGMAIAADAQSCIFDTQDIEANQYEGLEYKWSIVPSNAGTITEQLGNQIKIQWSSIGNHKVNLSTCAGTMSTNIKINGLPDPIVNHPSQLCENTSTLVSTNAAYQKYNWTDENNNVVSTVSNPDLLAGSYICKVFDANGCSNKKEFTINKLPKPLINLTTPDNTVICLASSSAFPKLYALNAEDDYLFTWYKDNAVLGGIATATYGTSAVGNYYVEVRDDLGCTNTSATISIVDDCTGGGGGTGGGNGCTSPSGSVDFVSKSISCSVIAFENKTLGNLPNTISWSFGDSGFSGVENPIHDYDLPGYYKVLLSTEVPDAIDPTKTCNVGIYKSIEVPLGAAFDYIGACEGELINFYDRSAFLPGHDITSWQWDFGDPASGIANNTSTLPDPTHVFTSGGTYTVKLIVGNTNCFDTLIKVVRLYDKPQGSILASLATCEDEAVNLALTTSELISKNSWDFGDPTSGTNNVLVAEQGYHTYADAGDYLISVQSISIYGCKATSNFNLKIQKNTLSGKIISSLGPIFCEGQTTQLTFDNPAIKYIWNDSTTSSQILVNTSGRNKLTVYDQYGCRYTPSPLDLQVNPKPVASIQTRIYNPDQSTVVFDDSVTVCMGYSFDLNIVPDRYAYKWNLGQTSSSVTIANPTQGSFIFQVTLTDVASNCTAQTGPIHVSVKSVPQVAINTSSSGILCEGIDHTLSVVNPQSDITYTWITSEVKSTIKANTPGVYNVIGKDQIGCEGKSNSIIIEAGPDASFVPHGCLERCAPDTMCFPPLTNAVSYQWYKDGTAISTSNGGNTSNPIFTSDGSYRVEMVASNGCKSTSLPLDINIKSGKRTILGYVYKDKNDDGVIGAADSLLEGIGIKVATYQAVTNLGGRFIFENLPMGDYQVKIDATTLPSAALLLIDNVKVAITSCEDTVIVKLLVKVQCVQNEVVKEINLCQGTTINLFNYALTKDTVIMTETITNSGCIERTVYNINFTEQPNLNFETKASCLTKDIGAIVFTSNDYLTYEYFIDNKKVQVINKEIKNLLAGNLTLVIKDQYSCEYTEEINIPIRPEVIYTTINEGYDCSTKVAKIGILPTNYKIEDLKYTWSNGNATNIINASNFGNHSITVDNGCIEKKIEINVAEPPKMDIEVKDAALSCKNTQVEIGVQIKNYNLNNLSFTWQGGASTNNKLTINKAGTYHVKVNNGCVEEDVAILVTTEKGKTKVNNHIACDGHGINLFGQNFTQDTVITIHSTNNATGCVDTNYHKVLLSPDYKIDYTVKGHCANEANGYIALTNIASPFTYTLNGAKVNIIDNKIASLSAGQYALKIEDNKGCFEKIEFTIAEAKTPDFEIESEDIDCLKKYAEVKLSFDIKSKDYYKVKWSNGTIGDTARIATAGTYKVELDNGCYTTTDEVVIKNTEAKPNFELPNIFAPDLDRVSKVIELNLTPFANAQIKKFELFGRDGATVYRSQDQSLTWDGTIATRTLVSGLYIYRIIAEYDHCGTKENLVKSGTITVIK